MHLVNCQFVEVENSQKCICQANFPALLFVANIFTMQLSEIATKADIEEVLNAIQKLQATLSPAQVEQKFLRSADVRRLLNISDGTLQRLRISGTLNAKKLNGTWFYKFADIEKLMSDEAKTR